MSCSQIFSRKESNTSLQPLSQFRYRSSQKAGTKKGIQLSRTLSVARTPGVRCRQPPPPKDCPQSWSQRLERAKTAFPGLCFKPGVFVVLHLSLPCEGFHAVRVLECRKSSDSLFPCVLYTGSTRGLRQGWTCTAHQQRNSAAEGLHCDGPPECS